MENQIDDFFRGRLESREATVSSDVWSRLENRLFKRRTMQYRFYAAAALVIISIVSGVWLWISPFSQKQNLVNNLPRKENKTSTAEVNHENTLAKVITTQELIKKPSKHFVKKSPVETIQEKLAVNYIPVQQVVHADEVVVAVKDDFKNSLTNLNKPESASIIRADQETDLVIYELIALQEEALPTDSQPKFIQVLTEWKREGISLGAVRDLKNDFFNKLSRIRHRANFNETKFETTEK